MNVKILSVPKIERETREVDIGNPGDFLLVRSKGKGTYTFGRLKDVTGPDQKGRQYVIYEGDICHLANMNMGGITIPTFRPAQLIGSYHNSAVKKIESVVSGIDNIINFLEREDSEYKSHADLMRKIRDAQGDAQ